MRQVMVRYTVRPEEAEHNAELVRAVYEELHRANPSGMRYATFQLEDGVSFVHIATQAGENEKAIDVLEELLKIPYLLTPARIRIDPTFAPLKGNPRFEKLLKGAEAS